MRELVYERWGAAVGRPLVLLHGFLGSRETWRHLIPALGSRRPLVVVDLPGHGTSPAPACSGPAGWRETLDALGGLLAAVSPAPVDLLGYSQGARIALGLAMDRPPQVRRLVLESGSPGLDDEAARAARRVEDEVLLQQLERDGLDAFVARWEALPLFANLARLPPETNRALRERRRRQSAPALAAALRALGTGVQPSYWDRLATFDTPTLLVTGALDTKFSAIARAMAAALPRAELATLPACGHLPHLEAPDRYAARVEAFLGFADRP